MIFPDIPYIKGYQGISEYIGISQDNRGYQRTSRDARGYLGISIHIRDIREYHGYEDIKANQDIRDYQKISGDIRISWDIRGYLGISGYKGISGDIRGVRGYQKILVISGDISE